MTRDLPAVRRAARDDAGIIRDLVTASWARTYDPLMGAQRRAEVSDGLHSLDTILGELANPGMASFVAVAGDGTLAGYALCGARDDATVHLHRLHIAPRWQGAGLADVLLAAAERAFPQAVEIDLEVFAANVRAIRFYERRGYRTVRTLAAPETIEGLETLVMARMLESR